MKKLLLLILSLILIMGGHVVAKEKNIYYNLVIRLWNAGWLTLNESVRKSLEK